MYRKKKLQNEQAKKLKKILMEHGKSHAPVAFSHK